VANSIKPGRPRKKRQRGGALSNGRHPFLALSNNYITQRKIAWADTTTKKAKEKYRYLNRVFEELKAKGETTTMNPKKFTQREIFAFEGWMKKKNLDPSTRKKYRSLLKSLMECCENYTYRRLIDKKLISTQQPRKEIPTVSYDEFLALLDYTKEKKNGWSSEVRHFILACYGYMGLRCKELRLSDLRDLDQKLWRFTVQHPKGEGSYGRKRTIPLVQPLRPIVKEYLKTRELYLKSKGIPYARPLIPVIRTENGGWGVSYYSSHAFRRMTRNLAAETGSHLQIKMLRASCGQFLIDEGASIEKVSKFLGHSSTAVTEKYYCRVRDEAMFQEVNALFSGKAERMGTIFPLIEKKNNVTGYL
jgi:integrase